MRIPAALAALFLLGTFAPVSLYSPLPIPAYPVVRFDPVPLSGADASRSRVGSLDYLDGWQLRSNDPRFGGISAIHVKGGNIIAVSDAGSIAEFALPPAEGAIPLRMLSLREGPGPLERKSNRDAEAMAIEGNSAWIGFENRNAVWRYARPGWGAQAGARPAAMRDWHHNRGSEAMVRLKDGSFLVFAESGFREDGTTEALLFAGDPAEEASEAISLRYKPPEGYRITDAAVLSDGRLLFLNRKMGLLGGFTAKLTLGPPPDPANVLTGAVIATLEPPIAVDNMEALSVVRENGRDIVWIASDDNFNPLQRTLLLKFALNDPVRP